LFVFFSFTVVGFSGVPNEIRYNGRLKSYNYPITGNMPFNFKIYDTPEGGTARWESGNHIIKLSSGVFTYIISPDESMVDWREKDFWLQIVVDGKELLPREKITAQPYSFHSYSAKNLSSDTEIKIEIGKNLAYIGMDGNSLYYKPSQRAEKECLGVPPGTVIAFAGNHGPRGYLLCDGREVDVLNYPDLFRAIGTIYGGNGTSKFKLPDFRGMFLRGAGGNAAPLGQRQGDAIRNIAVVQVGLSNDRLENVDINVVKRTSFDELCSIVKKSLLHIDIDGACSHIAWALRTKSIILFGPTDAKYSMYPENINIMSSICGGCWHRFGKCVIGEEKPSVCMNSINPEFVAEKAIDYISSLNIE
jgi:microcystin-dependent protein